MHRIWKAAGWPSTLRRLSRKRLAQSMIGTGGWHAYTLGGLLFSRNPSAGGGAGAPLGAPQGAGDEAAGSRAAISAWIGFNGRGPPSTIKEF